MPNVRITILKREFYQDLLEEHIPPGGKERDTVRCPVFEEGQVFVCE
jgi:hypothetical protein